MAIRDLFSHLAGRAPTVRVSVHGQHELNRTLMDIGRRGRDMRPVYQSVTDDILGWNKRQFDSQGEFGGEAWQSLAPSTMRQRKKLGIGPVGPILNRTGVTYNGRRGGTLLRAATVKGAAGQKITIGRSKFAFEVTDPVAEFHQTGTANMPKRKVVSLPGEARERIVKKAQRWRVTGQIL